MSKPTIPHTTDINAELSAQQDPVQILVFSGGGAKGAIYSGAVEALDKSGTRNGVSVVAGASAGSITAALIATGISVERFKDVTQHTDFEKELLGSRDWGSGLSGSGFYKAQGIESMMNKHMSDSVREAFGDEQNTILGGKVVEVVKQRLLEVEKEIAEVQNKLESNATKSQHEDLQEQFIELLAQSDRLNQIHNGQSEKYNQLVARCSTKAPLLFQDLEVLRDLDPKKFKLLAVNATRVPDGEMVVFSSGTTPNVPIATAVHASCSIPIAFKPVKIKIGDDVHEYLDGGVRSNVPTELFTRAGIQDVTDNQKDSKKSKTGGRMLAFAFGAGENGSDINTAVWNMKAFYSSNKILNFVVDVIFTKIIGGMKKIAFDLGVKVSGVGGELHSESEKKLYKRLSTQPLDVIALDTKDVGTFGFAKAELRSEYLHIKGEIQTTNHLDNLGLLPEDPNFSTREFLLKVYENCSIKHDGLKPVLEYDTGKAKKMLRFCENEKWAGIKSEPERIEKLKEYITEVARGTITEQLHVKSDTMPRLIAALNDPTTPSIVKKDFMVALSIEGQSPKDHKFQEQDFTKLLTEQQKHQPKTVLGSISQTLSKYSTTTHTKRSVGSVPLSPTKQYPQGPSR